MAHPEGQENERVVSMELPTESKQDPRVPGLKDYLTQGLLRLGIKREWIPSERRKIDLEDANLRAKEALVVEADTVVASFTQELLQNKTIALDTAQHLEALLQENSVRDTIRDRLHIFFAEKALSLCLDAAKEGDNMPALLTALTKSVFSIYPEAASILQESAKAKKHELLQEFASLIADVVIREDGKSLVEYKAFLQLLLPEDATFPADLLTDALAMHLPQWMEQAENADLNAQRSLLDGLSEDTASLQEGLTKMMKQYTSQLLEEFSRSGQLSEVEIKQFVQFKLLALRIAHYYGPINVALQDMAARIDDAELQKTLLRLALWPAGDPYDHEEFQKQTLRLKDYEIEEILFRAMDHGDLSAVLANIRILFEDASIKMAPLKLVPAEPLKKRLMQFLEQNKPKEALETYNAIMSLPLSNPEGKKRHLSLYDLVPKELWETQITSLWHQKKWHEVGNLAQLLALADQDCGQILSKLLARELEDTDVGLTLDEGYANLEKQSSQVQEKYAALASFVEMVLPTMQWDKMRWWRQPLPLLFSNSLDSADIEALSQVCLLQQAVNAHHPQKDVCVLGAKDAKLSLETIMDDGFQRFSDYVLRTIQQHAPQLIDSQELRKKATEYVISRQMDRPFHNYSKEPIPETLKKYIEGPLLDADTLKSALPKALFHYASADVPWHPNELIKLSEHPNLLKEVSVTPQYQKQLLDRCLQSMVTQRFASSKLLTLLELHSDAHRENLVGYIKQKIPSVLANSIAAGTHMNTHLSNLQEWGWIDQPLMASWTAEERAYFMEKAVDGIEAMLFMFPTSAEKIKSTLETLEKFEPGFLKQLPTEAQERCRSAIAVALRDILLQKEYLSGLGSMNNLSGSIPHFYSEVPTIVSHEVLAEYMRADLLQGDVNSSLKWLFPEEFLKTAMGLISSEIDETVYALIDTIGVSEKKLYVFGEDIKRLVELDPKILKTVSLAKITDMIEDWPVDKLADFSDMLEALIKNIDTSGQISVQLMTRLRDLVLAHYQFHPTEKTWGHGGLESDYRPQKLERLFKKLLKVAQNLPDAILNLSDEEVAHINAIHSGLIKSEKQTGFGFLELFRNQEKIPSMKKWQILRSVGISYPANVLDLLEKAHFPDEKFPSQGASMADVRMAFTDLSVLRYIFTECSEKRYDLFYANSFLETLQLYDWPISMLEEVLEPWSNPQVLLLLEKFDHKEQTLAWKNKLALEGMVLEDAATLQDFFHRAHCTFDLSGANKHQLREMMIHDVNFFARLVADVANGSSKVQAFAKDLCGKFDIKEWPQDIPPMEEFIVKGEYNKKELENIFDNFSSLPKGASWLPKLVTAIQRNGSLHYARLCLEAVTLVRQWERYPELEFMLHALKRVGTFAPEVMLAFEEASLQSQEAEDALVEDFQARKRNILNCATEDVKHPFYVPLCRMIYPERNYNVYARFDQFEDRSEDIAAYNFDSDGYPIEVTSISGHELKEERKEGFLESMEARVQRILGEFATHEAIETYIRNKKPDLQAQTPEGRLLEYVLEAVTTLNESGKDVSREELDLIVAYQLQGRFDQFVQSTSDKSLGNVSEVSLQYYKLKTLEEEYGNHLKDTLDKLRKVVSETPDAALFPDMEQTRMRDALSELGTKTHAALDQQFENMMKGAQKPTDEKLTTIIRKKVSTTLKNFQSFKFTPEDIEAIVANFDVSNFEHDTFMALWNEKMLSSVEKYTPPVSINIRPIVNAVHKVSHQISSELGKYGEQITEGKKRERTLTGYFSKTKAAALGAMVGDVCIATSTKRWDNKEYFDFNLMDPEREKSVGTAMLLSIEEDGKKYLLYCPNPSVGLCSEVSEDNLYARMTDPVIDFADRNHFDAIISDISQIDLESNRGRASNRSGLFIKAFYNSVLKYENGADQIVNLKTEHGLAEAPYKFKDGLRILWKREMNEGEKV